MSALEPLLLALVIALSLIIVVVHKIRKQRRMESFSTYTFSGPEGAAKLAEMCRKHGPLTIMIEPVSDAPLWPEGRILEDVMITGVEDYDIDDDIGMIAVETTWKTDRAIRTGLSRRILGP